jgi:hypothetical protein
MSLTAPPHSGPGEVRISRNGPSARARATPAPTSGDPLRFELAVVAKHSLYLPTLEDTDSIFDVGLRIQAFRQTLDKTRAWKLIPH